ncbi:MAG: two component transcriptional regulator, LytTR family [Bacteroidetes bacterium]|nr:two component transcriptional regulator, LytTR family [Bacteroidota bacterium]
MMKICCIAVEDEPPALEKLVRFIRDTSWLELLATFTKSIDAMVYLNENEVDLMFLDIRMPAMTGLQLLDTLQRKPQVIITTAYTEYALKGYEYGIVDYLLKPYSFERFVQAVQKIKTDMQPGVSTPANAFIFVKIDYRIVRVDYDDVWYIEGMRDYRCIVLSTGKILTSTTFSELEAALPRHLFARIHKSYMVSLQKIKLIEHHRIYMHDKVLPIGETYRQAFYQSINNTK